MMEASVAVSLDESQELALLDERLSHYLTTYPHQTDELLQAANYAVVSPGHRWRPILMLKVYDVISRKQRPFDVLPIACAVEYLHTASIILDDLPAMDDGALRRGKKACHLVFGQARAILSALWLCDVAQHLIHEFSRGAGTAIDLESVFRLTKNEMMKGQVWDIEHTNLRENEVIEKYRLKSGALYAFTAAAPARLLGPTELINNLTAFGEYLGIAYQTSDDLHDYFDTCEVLGKDVRKDENKSTLPGLLGVKRATQIRDFYKIKAINELSTIPAPVDHLVELAEKICR